MTTAARAATGRAATSRAREQAVLEVSDLTVQYPGLTGTLRSRPTVEGVGLSIRPGEVVGLVGVSGAGKSTVARALTGQLRPQRGRIRFAGRDLLGCSSYTARRYRTAMRLIVGDDYAALPPQRQVGAIVAGVLDPVEPGDRDRTGVSRPELAQAEEALESAGLRPAGRYLCRYPHQLTGRERQRVAFAIALATGPRLVVVDEPTTLLDAGRCHDLVEQLERLRAERDLAVLYLTHELELARRCCDQLVVLRGGRVVEHGPTERVCRAPEHPYTAELLSAGS